MPESFDPYYKWLGIPPKYQPPDHYRLLGIEQFESDPEVIEIAAEKQVDYLKRCATGPNVNFSQKLLNEVSAARLCLLNPAKKSAYDATLKADEVTAVVISHEPRPDSSKVGSRLKMAKALAQQSPDSGAEWSADSSQIAAGKPVGQNKPVGPGKPAGQNKDAGARKSSGPRKGPSPIGLIVSSLCGLGLAYMGYMWLQKRHTETVQPMTPEQAKAETEKSTSAANDAMKPAAEGSVASAQKVLPKKPVDAQPPPASSETKHGHEPDISTGRLRPDPSFERKPDQSKDTDVGSPAPPKPAAPQPAAPPPSLSERAAALTKLNTTATNPEQFSEVAEKGIDLVTDALAGKEPALAKQMAGVVLAAARKSDDPALEKRATLCFLEAHKH